MTDIFITENFLLQNDRRRRALSSLRPRSGDHRLPLPPAAAADRRGPPLRQPHADLALRRSLQVAGDAARPAWRNAIAPATPRTGRNSRSGPRCAPKTLRNPLYHWTHLELKRPFGISDRLLNPQTARGIWEQCNAMLARDDMSCRGIMRQMKVVLVCTTDDPVDSLEYHAAIAADPTFQDPRAAHLPARPGPGDRRGGVLQSLCRSFGRGEPGRDRRRLPLLPGGLAEAARFLPQGRLPAFRPWAGGHRRDGRHGPGSDRHFRPDPSRQPALAGGGCPLPLGHAL